MILAGFGRVRLGDEVRDVTLLDAVRVAPAVIRGFEAGPEGLEYLAFGTPARGGDAEIVPCWWELWPRPTAGAQQEISLGAAASAAARL